MANILQTAFSNVSNKNVCILTEISLRIVTKGPIYDKPALVRIMTCASIGLCGIACA